MAKRIRCRCLIFGGCSWSNCQFNRRCGKPTKRLKLSFLSAMSGEGLAVIRVSKRLNACIINQKAKNMERTVMTNLTPDEFRVILLESVEYVMKKKQDTNHANALNENLNDVFDEINKVKRELISLKEHVNLLSKNIDALIRLSM